MTANAKEQAQPDPLAWRRALERQAAKTLVDPLPSQILAWIREGPTPMARRARLRHLATAVYARGHLNETPAQLVPESLRLVLVNQNNPRVVAETFAAYASRAELLLRLTMQTKEGRNLPLSIWIDTLMVAIHVRAGNPADVALPPATAPWPPR